MRKRINLSANISLCGVPAASARFEAVLFQDLHCVGVVTNFISALAASGLGAAAWYATA